MYHYDTARETDIKRYVKQTVVGVCGTYTLSRANLATHLFPSGLLSPSTVANSEKIILAEIRRWHGMEARMESTKIQARGKLW